MCCSGQPVHGSFTFDPSVGNVQHWFEGESNHLVVVTVIVLLGKYCCFHHSLSLHYRDLPNNFNVMFILCESWTKTWVDFPLEQAEWFRCKLYVFSCGRHPVSSGETPWGLPLNHILADIRHRPHCCRGFLFVTAWNPQCWTPWPHWTQLN